jgi:hypothetical protein
MFSALEPVCYAHSGAVHNAFHFWKCHQKRRARLGFSAGGYYCFVSSLAHINGLRVHVVCLGRFRGLKKPPDSLRSGSMANSSRCFGGSQVVQSRIHPTSTHHTRRRSYWKRYRWLRFHLSLFVVAFAMFFSRTPGHYVCLAKDFDGGIRCFDDERVTILDDWNDYTHSGYLYFFLKR